MPETWSRFCCIQNDLLCFVTFEFLKLDDLWRNIQCSNGSRMYHRWWFIIHAIYLIGLMWSHINYYYIELFIVCANQYQSIAFCLCVTMMANRLWSLYIKYYARVIVSQPHTPRGKPGPSWSCAQCICSIMLKIVNRVFHFDSDKGKCDSQERLHVRW